MVMFDLEEPVHHHQPINSQYTCSGEMARSRPRCSCGGDTVGREVIKLDCYGEVQATGVTSELLNVCTQLTVSLLLSMSATSRAVSQAEEDVNKVAAEVCTTIWSRLPDTPPDTYTAMVSPTEKPMWTVRASPRVFLLRTV